MPPQKSQSIIMNFLEEALGSTTFHYLYCGMMRQYKFISGGEYWTVTLTKCLHLSSTTTQDFPLFYWPLADVFVIQTNSSNVQPNMKW